MDVDAERGGVVGRPGLPFAPDALSLCRDFRKGDSETRGHVSHMKAGALTGTSKNGHGPAKARRNRLAAASQAKWAATMHRAFRGKRGGGGAQAGLERSIFARSGASDRAAAPSLSPLAPP